MLERFSDSFVQWLWRMLAKTTELLKQGIACIKTGFLLHTCIVSVCLSAFLCLSLPTHPPTNLAAYPSIYLYIYLSIYLSICVSVHLSVCLPTRVHLPFQQSAYLLVSLPVLTCNKYVFNQFLHPPCVDGLPPIRKT